ncbi:hypothetical protein G7A66_00215 [Altererythrobacter sp. SALINAS58]|uniref:hypothetical protein n=1 Tax=Alteripontixanthobacter muriae TaxID=2705546 RepID=UPI00157695DC|nr:hypothetical protein [Alteripontixanthobacter muriae]NTZ41538.1 hypothetical protein [Alteripontixanthobacter muriae]
MICKVISTGTMLGAAAALTAQPVAAGQVEISRGIYVENLAADGSLALEPASMLRQGDSVVLIISWRVRNAERGFTVASAVPGALAFQRSSTEATEISTDGGRNWRRLDHAGRPPREEFRAPSPDTITHLRWRIAPNRASGQITYRALVR